MKQTQLRRILTVLVLSAVTVVAFFTSYSYSFNEEMMYMFLSNFTDKAFLSNNSLAYSMMQAIGDGSNISAGNQLL